MKKKRDAFQAQYSWQRTNDAAVLLGSLCA